MSSPWRSSKLRKDAHKVSTSAAYRKDAPLKGLSPGSAQVAQKTSTKMKNGAKPKETE